LEETPHFINEAIPYFALLLILDVVVKLWLQDGKRVSKMPVNDSVTSLMVGQYSLIPKLVIRGAVIVIYAWMYENFYIYEFPWNHPATWWVGFIGIDFIYYWIHRFGHGNSRY
jgi:alkylglycerol monooxygenase